MRSVLLILFGMCLCNICIAQYTVTKIIGQVSNRSTGEKLVPGSKLKDDDVLEFSSASDMVRVIVSGKGIYVISPTPGKVSNDQSNVIVEILKSALKLKSKEGYLSGRSGESELIPSALETETPVNTYHLIEKENRYLFDPKLYDVKSGRFFIQFEYPGTKTEIRTLKTSGDTLIVYATDFKLPQSNMGRMASFTLGYFSREKNSSEAISPIKPYIDTTGEMENIITLIAAENKTATKDSLRNICYAEVYEALGKPSPINFKISFDRLTAPTTKATNR